VDATQRVSLWLTNDEDLHKSVRVLARGWLERNGRFAPQGDLKMALVEYDSELGLELREWVTRNGVSSGSTSKIVQEMLGAVNWSEIAQELHNEMVQEMAERYPERKIYVP
jgi:hypothetical protein